MEFGLLPSTRMNSHSPRKDRMVAIQRSLLDQELNYKTLAQEVNTLETNPPSPQTLRTQFSLYLLQNPELQAQLLDRLAVRKAEQETNSLAEAKLETGLVPEEIQEKEEAEVAEMMNGIEETLNGDLLTNEPAEDDKSDKASAASNPPPKPSASPQKPSPNPESILSPSLPPSPSPAAEDNDAPPTNSADSSIIVVQNEDGKSVEPQSPRKDRADSESSLIVAVEQSQGSIVPATPSQGTVVPATPSQGSVVLATPSPVKPGKTEAENEQEKETPTSSRSKSIDPASAEKKSTSFTAPVVGELKTPSTSTKDRQRSPSASSEFSSDLGDEEEEEEGRSKMSEPFLTADEGTGDPKGKKGRPSPKSTLPRRGSSSTPSSARASSTTRKTSFSSSTSKPNSHVASNSTSVPPPLSNKSSTKTPSQSPNQPTRPPPSTQKSDQAHGGPAFQPDPKEFQNLPEYTGPLPNNLWHSKDSKQRRAVKERKAREDIARTRRIEELKIEASKTTGPKEEGDDSEEEGDDIAEGKVRVKVEEEEEEEDGDRSFGRAGTEGTEDSVAGDGTDGEPPEEEDDEMEEEEEEEEEGEREEDEEEEHEDDDEGTSVRSKRRNPRKFTGSNSGSATETAAGASAPPGSTKKLTKAEQAELNAEAAMEAHEQKKAERRIRDRARRERDRAAKAVKQAEQAAAAKERKRKRDLAANTKDSVSTDGEPSAKRRRGDVSATPEDSAPPSSTHQPATRQSSQTPTLTSTSVPSAMSNPRSFKKTIDLLYQQVAQHRSSSIFQAPIRSVDVPDYHEIVYRPMDLKTIKNRIRDGLITSLDEFERDIFLMFANATLFNEPGSDVYEQAQAMIADAEDQIRDFRQLQMRLAQQDN